MFPHRTGPGKKRSSMRTAVDDQLMEITGMDELTLRRLRKAFLLRCSRLPYPQLQAIAEAPAHVRFALMNETLRDVWQEDHWERWLRYLEHTPEDFAEMCRGEYPISPYLMRVFSALFGIKIDFLQLGSMPSADRTVASIAVLPLTGMYW